LPFIYDTTVDSSEGCKKIIMGITLEKGSGIKLRLRKGDMELEIEMGSDVDEKQIRAIQKILQPFAESITQGSIDNTATGHNAKQISDLSIYLKLKNIIVEAFRYGQWFTSLDAKEVFEDAYGVRIKLATCSTYLRRLEEEGFLKARKVGRIVEYRIGGIDEEKPLLTRETHAVDAHQ